MAVEEKPVHLTLRAGLDEATDKYSLQPGQLTTATNVRFRKDGSVAQRYGYTLAFNTKSSLLLNTGEGALVAAGKELLCLDGLDVVSYSPYAGAKQVCVAPRFTALTSTVPCTAATVLSQASAVYTNGSGNKLLLVVWAEQPSYLTDIGGYVYARVYDYETLSPISTSLAGDLLNEAPLTLGEASAVNAFLMGTTFVVTYLRPGGAEIYSRTLDIPTLTWTSQVAVVSDVKQVGGVANTYDAKPILGSTTQYALVYQRSADSKIRVCKINAVLGTTASAISLSDATGGTYNPSGFGVCATSGEKVFVTYGWDPDDGNGLRYKLSRITESTWAAEDASFPLTIKQAGFNGGSFSVSGDYCYMSGVVKSTSSTSCVVCFSSVMGYAGGTDPWEIYWGSYSAAVADTTVGNDASLPASRMLSAPFADNGRYYCLMQRDVGEFYGASDPGTAEFGNWNGSNRGTASVVDLRVDTDGSMHLDDCVLFPSEVPVTLGSLSFRPAVQYIDSNKSFVIATWRDQQRTQNINLCKLSDSDKFRYQACDDGYGIYLSGGLVCGYDRVSVYPVGFVAPPTWCRVGQKAATGGGGWTVTPYFAQVIHERIDGLGRVARSAVDLGVKKGTPLVQTVANATPANANVDPNGPIMQIVYPIPSDGWDTYYPGENGGRTRTAIYWGVGDANNVKLYSYKSYANVGSGYLSQDDDFTAPPSIDAANPAPYTLGGGVLEHDQPPCLISMVNYRNRLFGVDHTQRRIWFSNEMITGECAAFSVDLTLDVPFTAVALSVLDDKLIVFGETAIGVVQGYGPTATGDGNDLTSVEYISTDLGCSNPKSIVRFVGGVMFQSTAGIYLLGRGLDVQFIGQSVRDTLATYPDITSAIVHPTETVVRLSAINTAGSNGVIIVYDYRLDRWSVDSVLSGAAIISQAVCDGAVYVLTGAGAVYLEDATTHLDAGSFVGWTVRLAAFRAAGVQGWQRIRKVGIIGENVTPHDIRISLIADDGADNTAFQQATFTDTEILAIGLDNLQVYSSNPLGRALTVKVESRTPTGGGSIGIGAGCTLSGLSMLVGVYQGLNRQFSSQVK